MSDITAKNVGIKTSAARGALATLAGQGMRFAIQLASIVVLSRLLGPSVIGLFAMLAVIIGFGEVVRDFGLSSAMIQAKQVTQAQRSNLFWINAGIGVLLAVVCVGCAPLIAAFYRQPPLTMACVVISVVFILGGVGTQFRAQITRDLRFTAMSVIDVVAALIGLAIAVVLALMGIGIWALVVQQIVTACVTLLLNILAARWRPSLPSRHAGTRELIAFGWNVGCTQMINYASRNVDTIVIGGMFGPSALGIYNRAYQLMTVPINQLSTPATKVAFPILSRIRDDRARHDRFLLVGQRALVHLVGFVFMYTLVVASAGIEIALGPAWSDVAPIYRILAVGALAQAASFATYWVFLSHGKTREVLRMTILTRGVLIVSIVVAATTWGVFGVATAYAVVVVLTWPFSLYLLHRACPEAPTSRMFWQPLSLYIAYGIAGVGAYLATLLVVEDWLVIVVASVVYALILGVLVCAISPFRRDLREIAALRHLLRKDQSE